jgi:hypothetical protein
MKKFLLLIGMMLMLASCKDETDTVQISKEEYRMLKGDTVRPKYPKHFELYEKELNNSQQRNGIVLGSDQHEYLITNDGSKLKNVEHYIDCELCQERKQQPTVKIKYTENEQQ